MINWENIRETCPKAWAMQSEYFKYDDADGTFHTRMLYDFFDEHEIIIGITYYAAVEDMTLPYFEGDFTINGEYDWDYDIQKPTRPAAESAAFERAFQILEERL